MKKLIYTFICLQMVAINCGLFGDEAEAMPPRDGGMWQTMIMLAIAVLFGYFIMVRPQMKRTKAMETLRSSIKKGDRVTALGIIGTVVRVQDTTIILKMYDGSKIEVLKGAINEVIPGTEEDLKKIEREEKGSSKCIELPDTK